MLALFRIPRAILPEVKDNADDFGVTDAEVLGAAIPICGAAGDQQAATIGQACLSPGETKATYGTGAFVLTAMGPNPPRSANRRASAHASPSGASSQT